MGDAKEIHNSPGLLNFQSYEFPTYLKFNWRGCSHVAAAACPSLIARTLIYCCDHGESFLSKEEPKHMSWRAQEYYP